MKSYSHISRYYVALSLSAILILIPCEPFSSPLHRTHSLESRRSCSDTPPSGRVVTLMLMQSDTVSFNQKHSTY